MSDQASRQSRTFWDSGFYCAESVLLAIVESKGIHSPLIPKIATGFCSGLSRTGGMCGALSGAIMGMNLGTGRSAATDSLEECYALTQELIDQFEKRFGAINCPQLLGCDVSTEEGRRFYKDNHLTERCRHFVEEATSMTMSLLEGIPSS